MSMFVFDQESGACRPVIAVLHAYIKKQRWFFELKMAKNDEVYRRICKACRQTKDRKYIEGLNKRGYSDNVDLVLLGKNQCYHAGIRDNQKWYCHDMVLTRCG